MLMTLSWWQFLNVSDRISILATIFGCWCPTPMLKDRGCWWQKRPKPSPAYQKYRQHISSPASVTNIDVANLMLCFRLMWTITELWIHIWAIVKYKPYDMTPIIYPILPISYGFRKLWCQNNWLRHILVPTCRVMEHQLPPYIKKLSISKIK